MAIFTISRIERVTNIEVILTINQRKLLYLGHIMRGEKYQMLKI